MPIDLAKAKAGLIDWLRRSVLFPFLLPVFFVLHAARYFHGSIPALDSLGMLALYLLVTSILYLLVWLFVKGKLAQAIVTAMIIGLAIYWMPTIQSMLRLLHLGDNYNYYPIVLAIYFLVVFGLCRMSARLSEAASTGVLYYLNTLFAVFVIVEAALIAYYTVHDAYEKPLMAMNPAERSIDLRAKSGSNIYLMVFDEYASTVSLKEDWGNDNSSIDTFLRSRAFFINERSRSNYCWTLFSMASLLHMDYFREYRQRLNPCGSVERQQAFVAIQNNRLMPLLSHAGYEVESYSIFDAGNRPKQEIPDLMISKRKLITFNTFYNLLVRDYIPYIKHRAAMKRNPAYRYPPFYRMDDYNNEGCRFVMQAARQQSAKPRFVYAHFMMPHGTYYYDSTDHLLTVDQIKAIPHAEEPKYYWYNVQHTNRKMRQMIDSIQVHDPNAAIIVLGDHGYRLEREEGRHPEYFRNMSALYFPDHNYASVPDSFSNVNVFRIVLNKLCGTNYPLLPDRQYTLVYKND